MTIRMNPAHDTKNPPGQVREVDANGVTKGFDRYPFLKTSTHADPWPYKAPISPAKRLGDIIDGVVARSSERPSNRTEFEAAALPPLPEPAYWETMGRVYKDKTEAERVAWLTSETAGKSRPVYGVYTAGQMHEFRRTAIAAHAAQTEREVKS